jgi:hypothetical protein
MFNDDELHPRLIAVLVLVLLLANVANVEAVLHPDTRGESANITANSVVKRRTRR